MQVPLSSPDIIQKDIKAVAEVLKTRFLSIGPKIMEFEGKMCEFAGVNHAVAVNSGTSALHLIIRGLGIKEGDKILTTPFSFIACSFLLLEGGGLRWE